jgi:tetratricopeptide (TPR) repeat protein
MKSLSRLTTALLFGLFSFIYGVPAFAQNTISTADWQEDLRFLQATIHKDYPFILKKISAADFDAKVDTLFHQIPNLEAHEVPVGLARMVSLFGYGHTQIRYESIANGTALPVNLYEFTDGVFIEGAHIDHKEVVGSKVIAIEGIPIKEALEMIRPVVPVENEQYFKAFGLRFVTVPAVLHAQGVTSKLTETITMTLEKEGRSFEHRFTSIPLDQLSAAYNFTIPSDTWLSARDQDATPLHLKGLNERLFFFEYLEDQKTVYARQSKVRNGQDETLSSFYARMFDFIDTHDVERLVYDVRHNGGGNNYLNKPLIKGLIRSEKLSKAGALFFITGRRTFSAAQCLINEVDNYTDAIFVGEPTSENLNFYGDARPVKLPNSEIIAQLSFAWWQDKSAWENADWMYPDVLAAMSFEEYRTNQDPVLEAALNYDVKKAPVDPMEYMTTLFVEGQLDKLRTEALRMFKDPNYAFFDFENNINRAGRNLMGGANHLGAIMLLDLNIELFPDSANAWSSLGDAHEKGQDLAKAKTAYKQTILLDPKGPVGKRAQEKLIVLEKE